MRKLCTLSLVFSLFFSSSSFATDYVFTGNGEWNEPGNWQNGLMPTGAASDVIYINGTTRTSKNTSLTPGRPTCSGPACDFFYENKGKIIISAAGSLTLSNSTQFSNEGSIVVYGTLINATTFEGSTHGTVTVNGTLTNKLMFGNQGLVTVNNGGVIDNHLSAIFTNTGSPYLANVIGQLVINSGGRFINSGSAVLKIGKITNSGTLDNQSILAGNTEVTGNLTNTGTLAPGNSPGTYIINGNYTSVASAVHNFSSQLVFGV